MADAAHPTLLCDEEGEVTGEFLQLHNRLAGQKTSTQFTCTGGIHSKNYGFIVCTNPKHRDRAVPINEPAPVAAQTVSAVDHPPHYNKVPGIECIDVIEHFPLLRGTAIKYLWRAGDKDDIIQDLEKAKWYIDREINNIKKERASADA